MSNQKMALQLCCRASQYLIVVNYLLLLQALLEAHWFQKLVSQFFELNLKNLMLCFERESKEVKRTKYNFFI